MIEKTDFPTIIFIINVLITFALYVSVRNKLLTGMSIFMATSIFLISFDDSLFFGLFYALIQALFFYFSLYCLELTFPKLLSKKSKKMTRG